jgi:glycosyltransferase involved in cell wall biosynthesis
MDKIKITLITPVFNAEKYMKDCILSVVEQNCTVVEHLIIDGGSNDSTVDIIKQHADKYAHVSFLSEKDSGQSDAMNKGIKLAKGEYISFLNVDDFYEKGIISSVLELLMKEGYPDFIVGNCNVWDENGKFIYTNRPRKMKPWHILSGHHLSVNPTAYFYRKSIHDHVGVYNESNHMNMDIEFLIRASAKYEIKCFDEVWGNFRVLPDTKTYNDNKDGGMFDRKEKLFQKYLKELGLYVRVRTKLYLLSRRKWF